MKHLRKFNESETPKYEMELKDYFYDFTDNGFIVDIEGNTIKGKYTGNLDSATILDTFLDVVTKLKHYYGIAKTMFYNTTHSTSFTIELQHKPNENSIEVVLSSSNTKLVLNVRYYFYLKGSLTLHCTDIVNNKNISISWHNKFRNLQKSNGGFGVSHNIRNNSFMIGARKGKIDLNNVKKILKNILEGTYKNTLNHRLDFSDIEQIDPNTLVKI